MNSYRPPRVRPTFGFGPGLRMLSTDVNPIRPSEQIPQAGLVGFLYAA